MVEGHLFTKRIRREDTFFWKCTKRNNGCMATAKTKFYNETHFLQKFFNAHNHEVDALKPLTLKINHKLK